MMKAQKSHDNAHFSMIQPRAFYKFRQRASVRTFLLCSFGAAVLITVGSLVLVTAALTREQQMQREMEAAKTKAEIEQRKNQEVARFLDGILQALGSSVASHGDPTKLKEVLDQTAERVGGQLTNQPVIQGQMSSFLGQGYRELQMYAQAEQMDRAALALNQELYGTNSPEVAESLNDIGLTLWSEGNLVESEGALVKALDLRQQLFGEENPDVATSLNNLAIVYRGQRRLAQAETLLGESLGIRRKLFGDDSAEVADSLHALGILLNDEGKRVQSEAAAREILGINQRIDANKHAAAAPSLDSAAWDNDDHRQSDEAESLCVTALTIQRKILGDTNPAVAKTLSSFGELIRQQGNLVEAQTLLSAALSIQRKLLDQNDPDILSTLRSLAATFAGEGKWAEAEMAERQALSSWRHTAGNEDPEMAGELGNFVDALMAQGKLDEAGEILDEALTPAFVSRPSSVNLLRKRIEVRGRRGRWLEAASDAARAIKLDPGDPYRYHLLAVLLALNHERPAYEELCRKLLETFGNTTEAFADERMAQDCLLLPHSGVDLQLVARLADRAVIAAKGDGYALPIFQPCKAISDYRLGHYAEAINSAENSPANSQAFEEAQSCAALAMAHWQLGQKDQAHAALEKGVKFTLGVFPERENEDFGNDWVSWLIARIQLDEATALIQTPSDGANISK